MLLKFLDTYLKLNSNLVITIFSKIFKFFKYLFRSKSSLYKIQTLRNYRIIYFALNSVQVLWLD